MAYLDMIAFNLFIDIISPWCVGDRIQMQTVIRECFQQQSAAQQLMVHTIFGGLSHALTVFQQCCATSAFSCLPDTILSLTRVSNY